VFVERLILMMKFSLLVLVDHQVDLRREEEKPYRELTATGAEMYQV